MHNNTTKTINTVVILYDLYFLFIQPFFSIFSILIPFSIHNKRKESEDPAMEDTRNLVDSNNVTDDYDDGNIPEIDAQDIIPDEVPRRDGPGGE